MLKWLLGLLVIIAASAVAAWWWFNRPLVLRHPDFGTDCQALVEAAEVERRVDCIRVWYGTDRELEPGALNNASDEQDIVEGLGTSSGALALGRADIWLPKLVDEGGDRLPGETPHVQGALPADPNKLAEYVFLTRITTRGRESFSATLQDAIDTQASNSVLLFVHGFNVKFDDALVRTAQLSNDLSREDGFDVGVPVLYSWPSAGALSLEDYQGDRDRSFEAAPHLEAFLDILTEDLDIERINIIAHSMGNRVLTEALENYAQDYLERHNRGGDLEFRILLVAADVEREIFDEANGVFDNLDANVTIYTSDTDRALHVSNLVNRKKRLGDTDTNRPYIRTDQNYQTIDATVVTTELFGVGHNYYSDNPTILWDMMCTIGETLPQDRALEVARFGDEPDGAQYYRVNSDLSPGQQACKLRRDAFPTAGPVEPGEQPEITPSLESRSMPAPPEPIFVPQALPTLTQFYVLDYTDLDLTPYEAELLRSLEGVDEVGGIVIRAYSDTLGSETQNLEETARFAELIAAWYVDRGIAANVITAEGLGESQLAIETGDDVDQPLNRFVEIEVLGAS